ncbi:hypothetical protein AYI68_g2463 [Smittium mucronatum]|uniref:Uncharacterized protein n=1 Tax=Smittium mucronatum TaxID=133383 RepID=A0A1R0H2N4_9FUNG|nr:hypothetical protein AYI68_g2463 [Smittium mucronatum]
MTEVTCNQELSSSSMNNRSLNLLSSQSELTSNRINKLLDAEIRLNVERWTCAPDYVSAVINGRFLLFLDGLPLESLSSESLCAVYTIPNQE